MSKNYDNWEKLVGAVLKREQLRQLALSHSRDSSSISEESLSLSFNSSYWLDNRQLLVYEGQNIQSLESGYYDSMDDGSISVFPQDHRVILSRSVVGKLLFLSVEARELKIEIEENPGYHPYSFRYADSAVGINSALSIDIRGKIKTRLLTSKTIYGAYLVFKLDGKFVGGFESAKAMIRFVNDETDVDAERRAGIVHLQPVDERKGEMAVERPDGWMEVQIGNFYVGEGDDQEVEARVMERSRCMMGLIVHGIEFRPLVNVKRV